MVSLAKLPVLHLFTSCPRLEFLRHKILTSRKCFRNSFIQHSQKLHNDRSRRSREPGVQNWEFEVHTFGKLSVNSANLRKLNILCLNPQAYPMQNKSIIKVEGQGDSDNKIECKCDNHGVQIKDTSPDQGHSENLECSVEIPVKYDIDIQVQNKCNVAIANIENDSLLVRADKGDIYLRNIQSGDVNLETSGNVKSEKVLQGNIAIRTTDGNVSSEKVQGLKLDVQTDSGNIDMKAIYADQSLFTSKTGNVHLGSCHRDTTVNILKEGNLSIDSLDGELNADLTEGSVDVYLLLHNNVHINTCSGDITIKVPESVDTSVSLSGTQVQVDEQLDSVDLETISQGDTKRIVGQITNAEADLSNERTSQHSPRRLQAHTQSGCTKVVLQDWLASLNLMGKTD